LKHKCLFTPWTPFDLDSILFFRICKCKKVELRGDIMRYNKIFSKGEDE